VKHDLEKQKDHRTWEDGFDGHADAQMLRLAALSFREKVEWLEMMQKRFAKIKNLTRMHTKNNTLGV
jgi:hypothetical protein